MARYELTTNALIYREKPTQTEWRGDGEEFAAKEILFGWALVDWLVEGVKRGWVGSGFTTAAKITNRSTQHMSNMHQVGQVFLPGSRFALSVSHHVEVMSVQNEMLRVDLLKMAVEKKLSLKELREHIAHVGVPRRRNTKNKPRKGTAGLVHVKCEQCGHVQPIKGHKVPPP